MNEFGRIYDIEELKYDGVGRFDVKVVYVVHKSHLWFSGFQFDLLSFNEMGIHGWRRIEGNKKEIFAIHYYDFDVFEFYESVSAMKGRAVELALEGYENKGIRYFEK